jgi:hypothetical protein
VTLRPTPFAAYLTGLGAWFVPLGIQMVVFSWPGAIVLRLDAFAVGIAQVALMAPGILFLPLVDYSAAARNPRPSVCQTSCKAASSRVMSSSECSGVGVSRSRSVPRGTVG